MILKANYARDFVQKEIWTNHDNQLARGDKSKDYLFAIVAYARCMEGFEVGVIFPNGIFGFSEIHNPLMISMDISYDSKTQLSAAADMVAVTKKGIVLQ